MRNGVLIIGPYHTHNLRVHCQNSGFDSVQDLSNSKTFVNEKTAGYSEDYSHQNMLLKKNEKNLNISLDSPPRGDLILRLNRLASLSFHTIARGK